MTITVGGTSITFSDGTTQTTAAGAPTTAQVLSATAGASVGAVGTYALLARPTNSNIATGATSAGSQLKYAQVRTGGYGAVAWSSTSPSGTWRAMGTCDYANICGSDLFPATLWLRVS